MTVYIEYVLLDNIFIDYSLLKATFLVQGIKTRKRRLFLCSVLGGLIALFFPIVNFNIFFTGILKILSGCLMVLIATKFSRWKEYYVSCVLFIVFTFSLGGIIIGAFSIFDIDYSSELSIALICFPSCCFLKIFLCVYRYLALKGKSQSVRCFCTVYHRDKKIELKGLIDTGNGLSAKSKPVLVVNKEDICKVLNLKDYSASETLCYKTAYGKGEMHIFDIDRITVEKDDGEFEFERVTLGVGNVAKGQIILSPLLFS